MDRVVHIVFLTDNALREHVGKLFNEPFNVRYRCRTALDLDPVTPGIQNHPVGALDQPEVRVPIAKKAWKRMFVLYGQVNCGGFHSVDVAGNLFRNPDNTTCYHVISAMSIFFCRL